MRETPIYPATIVGQPPMEDGWMGKAVERIFMPMIKPKLPDFRPSFDSFAADLKKVSEASAA